MDVEKECRASWSVNHSEADVDRAVYILPTTVLLLRYQRAAALQRSKSSLRPWGVRASRNNRRRTQATRKRRIAIDAHAVPTQHVANRPDAARTVGRGVIARASRVGDRAW